MGQVILFVLSVLLANVHSWGGCETVFSKPISTPTCRGLCQSDYPCRESYNSQGYIYHYAGKLPHGCDCSNGGNSNEPAICQYYKCTDECSLNQYQCDLTTHNWIQDSCKCVPKPEPEADSSFTICTEDIRNGTPYATIYGVTCHYKNGVVETCCGVPAGSISGTGYQSLCPQLRSVRGSCENNGVPNGPSNPTAGKQVPDLPNSQCYAVVGYTCYMRDYNSGNTYSCECDGDCQEAYRQQMQGYGCRNPYPQPQPSSSGSGGGESSPSSSGSEPPSSSGSGGGDKDYTEQLNQIIANTQGTMNNTADISQWTQTTMNNTTDIKNNLTEIGIDVSHIRTNTEETATNTGSIDNKLNTTNSLLNDIKNKNWNPQINVNPPTVNVGGDTIIVNVGGDSLNINVDTAKAPAEILGFLKGVFGDTTNNYNASDTVGTGTREGDLIAHLDSQVNGGVPDMRDSIPHAVTGVKGALTGLKDSINNGPYGDSLAVWQNQLLNNGVITGSGSNDCPAPLRRSFSWNFGPKIGTVQLGSLRFICEDALGLGFSLWTLARTLLRAMVAICCMLWIYREVTGSGGGSNDED